MTDKELEQVIEKECLKISLPIALQFAEEFQRSYPDKRPIHELMAELNEAIRDALISARRELEEKKDAILQSAAKIIEQSKEIERLQRVEFELRRQLESRPESELVCEWTNNYDPDERIYDTSCGQAFVFIDGSPEENKMQFCCYCGKKLAQLKGTER